jgi:hypothetical protein
MLASTVMPDPDRLARRDVLKLALAVPLGVPFVAPLAGGARARGAGHPEPTDLLELAGRIAPLAREKAFELFAALRRDGVDPRTALGAVFVAGAREIEPRPVGFQLHAVMMVASAFDVMQRSPAAERWLPVFWNLADLKRSQRRDAQGGDWSLPPRPAPAPGDAAAALRQSFAAADEAAADRACVALHAQRSLDDAFEILWPQAMSSFHNLGHFVIHAAQCHRALQQIGWLHGEDVLRALALALLAPGDERAQATNGTVREQAQRLRDGWQAGAADAKEARRLQPKLRPLEPAAACQLVAAELNGGRSAATIWDALRLFAFEQLLRRPGILAVHPITALNAFRWIAARSAREDTRRTAILQCAAWLSVYAGELRVREGKEIDAEAAPAEAATPAGLRALLEVARKNLLRKSKEHHDWKLAAAVFEETEAASPELAPALLLAAGSYLRREDEPDGEDYRLALLAIGD